jgi:cell division protein FtsQ
MTHPVVLPVDVRILHAATAVLWAILIAMATTAAGLWLIRHDMWAIQSLEVRGQVEHQSEVLMRAHVASRLQGTLIDIDLDAVQEVVETLPWVRRAQVQRVFPNRLRVVIEEHQGVAWWGEAQAGRMVNNHGEIFEAVADQEVSNLWPELHGSDLFAPAVLALYQALDPLFAPLQREVVRLEQDGRGAWRVRLDNGARIELGRGDVTELAQRTQMFTETVQNLLMRYGQRDIETADLRYPNGYALRLRGVTTLPIQPITSS